MRRTGRIRRWVCLLAGIGLVPAIVLSADLLAVARFSAEKPGAGLPGGWEPLAFKNISARTTYTLVEKDGRTVVRAESRASASGLIRKMTVNLEKWPVLSWRWQISNVYEKGDVSRKAGDDYPARIYVAFPYEPERAGFFQRLLYEGIEAVYGEYPPGSALNYIWANRAREGAAVPNPYSDRAMMIAVQSGDATARQWVTERRNVLEDYRRLFGEDPPAISGVAIMTDSDNTGESATAWYGDISFHSH